MWEEFNRLRKEGLRLADTVGKELADDHAFNGLEDKTIERQRAIVDHLRKALDAFEV